MEGTHIVARCSYIQSALFSAKDGDAKTPNTFPTARCPLLADRPHLDPWPLFWPAQEPSTFARTPLPPRYPLQPIQAFSSHRLLPCPSHTKNTLQWASAPPPSSPAPLPPLPPNQAPSNITTRSIARNVTPPTTMTKPTPPLKTELRPHPLQSAAPYFSAPKFQTGTYTCLTTN